MKTILFIVPSPEKISPSARFRVELYEDVLSEHGFSSTYSFFWDRATSKILYKKGHSAKKMTGLVAGFARRVKILFVLNRFDYVFILRETTPVGPPVFEWLLAKLFRKKIIYDFDDAIWVNQAQGSNAWVRFFKSFSKVRKICQWSYKVSVGNQYLYNFAVRYNARVVINPTCVDTLKKHRYLGEQPPGKPVIGWTGSFSQLVCLDEVIGVLQELDKIYDFEFILIADKNPLLPLTNYTFLQWNESTEIEDLSKINIGIMPLPDNEFTRGKCGFKLIQFMALGIPVAASPVEVNNVIVDQNVNGFLCKTREEWFSALEKLLKDASLRAQMGARGREKIVKHYSVESNKANFLSLFT